MTKTHIALVERLVDALVPGDGAFPSASSVGVQAKLLERGHTAVGPGYVDQLLAALGLTTDSDDTAIVSALSAYEKASPEQFEMLLNIVYMSYYESLEVKAAIRAMGHTYNDTPQPAGYSMSVFNPANPLENPTHRRGYYVPTDEVRPVDWQPLGDLGKRVG